MSQSSLSAAQLTLGPIGTNCYLLVDSSNGDGVVFDPAVEDSRIAATLQEMGIRRLRYICLTHGHFDHILGVPALKAAFPQTMVVAPQKEEAFFSDPVLNLAAQYSNSFTPISVDRYVKEGDVLPFGSGQIRVLETPGHTAGSVCYLLDSILFSGDTLFRGSMGITSHPTGDAEKELESLQKLAALPGDYNVLPGHGPLTTLQRERETNPYMKDLNS